MADNLSVKDALGVSQTIAMTDVSSVLLPKHKINDGTNDVKTGTATSLAGQSSVNALQTVPVGNWAVKHAPAAATQATAAKSAGASGVRHVCTSISATFAAGATPPTAELGTLNLRDGATGAGTILGSWTLGVEATACRTTIFTLSGLNIIGTAATAMTLEFAAAGGSNTTQSVTMTGYSTPAT